MTARIILVRHGPSSHIHTGGSIDRVGVARWLDAYDVAGIQPGSEPPAVLVEMAARATHIVASDLLRAVASAERLAHGRPIQLSETLREATPAIPPWPTRLPLTGWALLAHVVWRYRLVRGTDASDAQRARAGAAADLLADMVADGSTALVVTHVLFRRLIAQQLVGRGWTSDGRAGGYDHWSSWAFSRAATK